MKKSVAIIVCSWPPQGGGIGNNANYQARFLSDRGHKVGVFTPDFSGIQTAGDKYSLRNLKTFLHLGKAGFLRGLFRELPGYDIIHLYYPFFGTDLLVWLYKALNPGVRLVVHYEMDPIGEGLKSLIFFVYVKIFLGLIVKKADRIGVLSFDHAENSYLAKYLKRYPNKFTELPNGIDIDIFQPQPKNTELMEMNKISVHDKVIVFVGGLDSQHYFKGVSVLLEAFSRIPINYFPNILDGGAQRGILQELRGQAKLLIIGDGNLRSEFEQIAKDLQISDRVIFTGWVKNEDLPPYYALADIFVLPSTARTESFGIVAAEAQACGLPALVSDYPGVRSTIINNETGYLAKPGDSLDLAGKLKALLNDDQLRFKMGRAGLANAREKFDWQKIIVKLESLYDGI